MLVVRLPCAIFSIQAVQNVVKGEVSQKVTTVIYLFTIEFIDGNFIHFIFKFSQVIFRCSEVFNPTSYKYAISILKKHFQLKEDLALITALNHSGFFGKNVVKF